MITHFRPASRLVILKENKILLCRMWNVWWLPWGWIDIWESIPDALNRESIEELWIKAQFEKIIFIQDFLVQFHALEYFCTVKNNSDYFDVVNTYHTSSHAHELKDLNWFDLDNIPEDMMPLTFLPVLKKYIKNPEKFSCEYISGL